jgi:hypothetical protein
LGGTSVRFDSAKSENALHNLTIAVVTLVALLAGCAQVPMAPMGADAEGKRFDPPAPGSAVLYLYRDQLLGGETVLALSDNQQPIGKLADKTWLRTEVAPGPHAIACSSLSGLHGLQTVRATTIDLAPGDIRFMEIALSPGPPFSPRCTAIEVPADQGRAEVRSGHRTLLAQ